MFSIMTMASSTTKPTEIVSAMSEKLSSAKPSSHIAAERAGERQRHGDGGGDGRDQPAHEQQHHQQHQGDGDQQRDLDVVDAGADGLRAVRQDGQLDVGRHPACSCGSSASTRSTVSMTLAPADLVMVSRIAGCVPVQAASWSWLTLSTTLATSDRRTTAPLLFFSTSGA